MVPARAAALPCQRCGAAFPLTGLTDAVFCPYCGHQQAISAELRQELARYEGAVEREMRQAGEAHLHAAAWQQWSEGRVSPQRNLAVGLGFMLGLPLVASVVVVVLAQTGAFEPGPWLGLAVMGATMLGMIGYVIWYSANQKRAAPQRARAAAVRVACPNCGAIGELTPGDAVDTCGYCRAALIPAATARARGVDAATAARREALLQKYRHERAGYAQIQRYNMSNAVPYIVIGSFSPMLLLSALAFTFAMLTGDEPFHPGILVLWACVFALGGAMVVVYRYRRGRRAALHAALTDLTRQFRGTVVSRLTESVEWLNRYWAGEYSVANLVASPYFAAAALEVRGYPALIDLDACSSGQHRRPRLNVLLAAAVPDGMLGLRGKQLPTGAHAAKRVHDLGFTLRVSEAGLLATAGKSTLDAVRRTPQSLHEVAPLLTALADYADAIGARLVADAA